MFAGMRPLIFAHHREGLLGDGTHLFRTGFVLHVQYRAHMQTPYRGVGIPGACGAVFVENLGQALGVFGEVFQSNSTVFNERDRLAVSFHRHHDVEAGFTHLPDGLLQFGVRDLDHGTGKTERPH